MGYRIRETVLVIVSMNIYPYLSMGHVIQMVAEDQREQLYQGGFGLTPQNGSIQIFPQILPLVATLKTRPNRLIFRFLFLSLCLW